jgi:TonB family protein
LWVLGALIIGIAAVAVALIVTRNREPGGDSSNQIASTSPVPKTTEPGVAITPATTTTTGNAAATPQAQTRSATPSPSTEKKAPTAQPETRQTSKDSPAPPPPETPAARRGPISAGVLNGKAINLVKPTYPPIARAANASGAVNVQVTIDEQGNVISAQAVSGHPLLRPSAVSAARASTFRPTMLSGQPVKVTGVITYNFVVQ